MSKKEITDHTLISHIGAMPEFEKKEPAIHILGGPTMGQQILLKNGTTTWGRSPDADVTIPDETVSRLHFKIKVVDKMAILEDLGSTNGTFVNGQRVHKQILQQNDKIQISSTTVLRFSYVDPIDQDVHQRFYEMALFDPVTQAHTKRYFLDQMDHEFAYAKRKNLPLSLMIFDLDYFKKVNDTYGHPAGDFVLQEVSQLTKSLVRLEDIFARYGGEEFVILMRETVEHKAAILAERIRQAIEAQAFVFEDKKIPVTVSLGVACFDGKNFKDSQELVKRADEALYAAKAGGRNRVSVASEL